MSISQLEVCATIPNEYLMDKLFYENLYRIFIQEKMIPYEKEKFLWCMECIENAVALRQLNQPITANSIFGMIDLDHPGWMTIIENDNADDLSYTFLEYSSAHKVKLRYNLKVHYIEEIHSGTSTFFSEAWLYQDIFNTKINKTTIDIHFNKVHNSEKILQNLKLAFKDYKLDLINVHTK